MKSLSIKKEYKELIKYLKKYYLMTDDEAVKVIEEALNKNNTENQKNTKPKNFSIFKT